MSIKTGIIGAGSSGREIHYNTLSKMPRSYEVVAFASRSNESLKRIDEEWTGQKFLNYEDMLREKMELVVIATTPWLHKEMAIKAMESGKHVVIEKPLCMTATEADELIACAKSNNVTMAPFQNRRWYSTYLTVKNIIDSGQIGKPYILQVKLFAKCPLQQGWAADRTKGGGPLYNWGAHVFDQLLQLIDSDVETVYCAGLDYNGQPVTKDNIEAYFDSTLQFRDGTIAELEVNFLSAQKLPWWFVVGDKGSILAEAEPTPEGMAPPGWNKVKVFTDEEHTVEPVTCNQADDALTLFYEKLHDSISQGTEFCIKTHEVREVCKIIDAALESMLCGKIITL